MSTGWCQKIVSGVPGADESYLQVVHINPDGPIIKLTISDGQTCMTAGVTTQAKAAAAELQKGSIIQADTKDYNVTTMGGQ